MTINSHMDQKTKATAIYREGKGVAITPETSGSKYTGIAERGAEFIADYFPHIVGCKLRAYHIFDGNRKMADIKYVHPDTTAFIQILIHPVESNKVAIIILRAIDELSPTGSAIPEYHGLVALCRCDHAATVKIEEDGTLFSGGEMFSCIVSRIGKELSNSVRVSNPLFLDVPDDTEGDSDRVKAVLELDDIAKSLGDRLHKHYGHKIDTKK